MDIFNLNMIGGGTISQPTKHIQHINKLKWVERFYDVGEIELSTPWSPEYRELLSIGEYLWSPESKRIMRIDTYSVNDKDGLEITVKGKSIEDIYNYRIAFRGSKIANVKDVSPYSEKTVTDPDYLTKAGMVTRFAQFGVVGSTGFEQRGVIINRTWPHSKDVYPGRDSDGQEGDKELLTDFKLPYGTVMNGIKQWVGSDNVGMPAILRKSDGGRTSFYKSVGIDRSGRYSNSKPTIFLDHLPSSRKLIEQSEYYNGAVVHDESKSYVVHPPSSVSGLDSRYIAYDYPRENNNIVPTDNQMLRLGRESLKEHPRKALIDLEVDQFESTFGYVYDQDYYLGDTVLAKDVEGDLVRLRLVEHSWFVERDGSKSTIPTFQYVPD